MTLSYDQFLQVLPDANLRSSFGIDLTQNEAAALQVNAAAAYDYFRGWSGNEAAAPVAAAHPIAYLQVQPAPIKPWSNIAVTGFVFAMIWVFVGLLPGIGVGIALIAAVLGHVGLSDTRGAHRRGRALSIWAVTLGWIGLVLGALVIAYYLRGTF